MRSVVVVAALALSTIEREQQDAVLSYVATSQAANLSQLEYGSFTFELVVGKARGPEEAARGELDVAARANGSYVFDGENAVYRCIYDDANLKDLASVESATKYRINYMSVQALTDRKSTCLDVKAIVEPSTRRLGHTVAIFPDEDQSQFRTFFRFVQPLGYLDQATRFTSELPLLAEKKTRVSELSTEFQRDGRKMIRVVFETEKHLKRAYTLDPERGCLPVATENLDQRGALGTMTLLGEVFYCADRCWLPKSTIDYNAMNGTATLIKLTSFDVQKRPSLTDFRLDFDTAVIIPDSAKNTVYEKVTTISLRDQKSLKPHAKAARFVKPIAGSALEAPPMPGELETTHRYGFTAAIVLASAAVLLSAILIRKRWVR
jgi:hypothetical protein